MDNRQDKKAQFQNEKKKSPVLWVLGGLLIAGAVVGVWLGMSGSAGVFKQVSAEGGKVIIPLAQVSDGKAHFFSYRDGRTNINFFVLKSGDGVIRAAFDTCDVCYKEKKGYRQEGDLMVCNNCNQTFPSNRINDVKGGCNPAPLVRLVGPDRVLIAEADLKQGAWYFQGK